MLLSLILAQVLTANPDTGQLSPITATSCSAGQFVKTIANTGAGTCAAASGSGDLLAANNLSELTATASTARTNLGLGTLATQSGTFSGTSSGTNTGDQTNISGNAATVTTNANLTGIVTSTGNATSIADGAIALAKLANGTAGNVVTYSAAGAITVAATGTSGQVLTSNGAGAAPTFQTPAAGSGPTYVRLTANRTNATTSYADITDLIIPVSANTRYDIECRLIYSANATTTGIGIGWTGPASPTLVGGQMIAGLTSATVGGTTSVGNDTGGVTTASVATSGNFATFHGIWSNGANAGNVQMRFRSEVAIANAIVIQAGSYCKYNVF